MGAHNGSEYNPVALVSPPTSSHHGPTESSSESPEKGGRKRGWPALKIGHKLMLAIFLSGLTPLAVMGGYAVHNWSQALAKQSYDRLAAAVEAKKDQVERLYSRRVADLEAMTATVLILRQEAMIKITAAQETSRDRVIDFFEKVRQNLSLLAASPDALQAFVKLRTYKDGYDDAKGEYLETIDPTTDDYARLYDEISPFFKSYAAINGYDNIFIVDVELRNVMFSLEKKADLGANLAKGPLKDSGLGRAVEQAIGKGGEAFEDFSPYPAAEGRQAAFVAAPIKDAFNRIQAVLVFQFSPKPLQDLVGRRDGMGRTGETFIITQRDGKIVLRSEATALFQTTLAVGQEVPSQGGDFLSKALAGEKGRESFSDAHGRPVLVAHDGLDVLGRRWAVISMAPPGRGHRPAPGRRPNGFLYQARPGGRIFRHPAHLSRKPCVLQHRPPGGPGNEPFHRTVPGFRPGPGVRQGPAGPEAGFRGRVAVRPGRGRADGLHGRAGPGTGGPGGGGGGRSPPPG
ncbi:MAG: cache domain-containing protein [Pseudomonadota bacterium]